MRQLLRCKRRGGRPKSEIIGKIDVFSYSSAKTASKFLIFGEKNTIQGRYLCKIAPISLSMQTHKKQVKNSLVKLMPKN